VRKYNITTTVLIACLSMCTGAFAQGAQSSGSTPTIASVLDRGLGSIEREVMAAADAVPEDKYDFSPATANVPGDFKTPTPVRTMGEQFKHIGDALEAYSSLVMGEKPPQNNDENGPKNMKSKSDVINYLKASFAKAHSAINTITSQNAVEPLGGNGQRTRLALAVSMIGHSNNHYGQIIEYLRMNNMVPPESQPQK
jgi:uncharacterized damage-inducible protein DinB